MRSTRFRRRPFRRQARKKRFHRFAKKVLRVSQEKKYSYIFSPVASPVSFSRGTPLILSLTNIAQGDTDNTRDGNMWSLRSFEIHLQIAVNPSYTVSTAGNNPWGLVTANPFPTFRLLVWQWLPTSDPTTASLINLLMVPSTSSEVMAPYNHDQRRNFRVLLDRTKMLSLVNVNASTDTYSNANSAAQALIKLRIRKLPIRNMLSTGSSGNDPATGHVFLALCTDFSVDGGASPFDVQYAIKTNFSDM